MVKAGKQGVYLFTGDASSVHKKLGHSPDAEWNNRQISCPAFYADPDRIINASGAGDTAIAAFLTAILSNEKPETALKYAAVAGRNSLYCNNLYRGLNNRQEMSETIKSERNRIHVIKI
jgi:sugar/nucleoside kinase (ribokinase family)